MGGKILRFPRLMVIMTRQGEAVNRAGGDERPI
jgi:hypothetical protein